MATAQQFKASDKQAVSKKLMALLKKQYKGSAPKQSLPVLETLLYAVCLENSSHDEAETTNAKLSTLFHDLNEVRVSSISELAVAFENSSDPERRAHQVRSALQFVFEKYYSFDFEVLRKKTYDQASKQLAKMKDLSPFVRSYTLQCTLGSHIVPVDDYMHRAAIWLGFIPPGTNIDKSADELKSTVRKSDVSFFCYCLRRLVNDPKVREAFTAERFEFPEEGYDLHTAFDRLSELLVKGVPKKRAKKTAKKKTVKKKAKKASAQPTTRKVAKTKTTAKKSPARKKTASSKAVKKKVVKNTAAKKVSNKAAKKKVKKKR